MALALRRTFLVAAERVRVIWSVASRCSIAADRTPTAVLCRAAVGTWMQNPEIARVP